MALGTITCLAPTEVTVEGNIHPVALNKLWSRAALQLCSAHEGALAVN
jgi:hypothetical protein